MTSKVLFSGLCCLCFHLSLLYLLLILLQPHWPLYCLRAMPDMLLPPGHLHWPFPLLGAFFSQTNPQFGRPVWLKWGGIWHRKKSERNPEQPYCSWGKEEVKTVQKRFCSSQRSWVAGVGVNSTESIRTWPARPLAADSRSHKELSTKHQCENLVIMFGA